MEIDEMLRDAGITGVAALEPLADGTYNSAVLVRRAGAEDLVVKVAPAPAEPAMTYEHGLLPTEALFYRAAAGVTPVPRVVHTDFSRTRASGDILVMTALPGRSWYSQRDAIGAGRTALRHRLGEVVAGLHGVTGDAFGYPQNPPVASWREAFRVMIDDVLQDAERFTARLPRPVDDVRDAVRRNAGALDAVTAPALVRFDLWDGNLLVRDGELTGIVDGERAFWGDPLAELVSLALFGDITTDDAFLAGYRATGRILVLDEPARRRLALYRCYLYLIMLIEVVPRGHGPAERESRYHQVAGHLERALGELA